VTVLSAQVAHAGSTLADAFDKAAYANAAPGLPAVDGVNWKGEAMGGSLGHKSLVGARGAITFPLGHQYGAQIDVQGGSLGGDGFAGVAGHLFWRDPGRGLIGAYVSHTYWSRFDGASVTHVAAEGEYYWGRWTLQGIVGVEFGDSATRTTTSVTTTPQIGQIPASTTTAFFMEGYDVKTRFFDQINLKYYMNPNWAAYVGHRYLGGQNALALGSEWAFPVNAKTLASAFVEGRAGSGKFQGIWGGLRVYYGPSDKTLIERHRQGDPGWWDDLISIVNQHFNNSSSSTTLSCTQSFPGFDTLVGNTCVEGAS